MKTLRDYINLVENKGPIEVHYTDYYSGQQNFTLIYKENDQVLGTLEASQYKDEVSINMIDVREKRKGVGTALVKHLQRLYPETELQWGMMTDEGSALKKSLTFKKVETEYAEKFVELEKLKKELETMTKFVDEYDEKTHPTDEEKKRFLEILPRFNDINDRIYGLEDEVRFEKPYAYLIEF